MNGPFSRLLKVKGLFLLLGLPILLAWLMQRDEGTSIVASVVFVAITLLYASVAVLAKMDAMGQTLGDWMTGRNGRNRWSD